MLAMGKRGPNYKPGVSFILVGIVKHRVRIVVVAVVNAIIIQYALYYYFYYYLPCPALHNPNSNLSQVWCSFRDGFQHAPHEPAFNFMNKGSWQGGRRQRNIGMAINNTIILILQIILYYTVF